MEEGICECCGSVFQRLCRRNAKRFCSDVCRVAAWRAKNPDQRKQIARNYRVRNLAKCKFYQQKYRAENRERLLAKESVKRAANPGEAAKKMALWRMKNPERARDHWNRARAGTENQLMLITSLVVSQFFAEAAHDQPE